MTYSAVLFDCDGVLIDSETIATRSLHRSLLRLGLDYSEDEVGRTFTGHSWPDCMKMIEASLGGALPDSFMTDNEQFFNAALRAELTTMDGIERVLDRLDRPFALVTNSRRNELDMKLEVSGLDAFFPAAHRFDAETLGVAKPDPAIYQQAAAAMKVDIRDCLVLEDSLPGLTAASRAGATVWAYRPLVSAAQMAELSIARTLEHWDEFDLS
ncbi:HAD family phosphatase [Natronospirillum operosum]|uniref:HAD family phosphatase n=1 Tax=Natronospirillum operosum TaxID=2759953 RepID=A0A4Z0W688_9GAMM|nr:HAD family phosphatase [Natronospirillum operosum]TGG90301.1 HAD family phosphatase [Natronospirillum operosum]